MGAGLALAFFLGFGRIGCSVIWAGIGAVTDFEMYTSVEADVDTVGVVFSRGGCRSSFELILCFFLEISFFSELPPSSPRMFFWGWTCSFSFPAPSFSLLMVTVGVVVVVLSVAAAAFDDSFLGQNLEM